MATRWSSAPNAGAMCTRPVPASVVTWSPWTTRCAVLSEASVVGDEVERTAVVAAEQVGAREAVGHPGVLAQHRQEVLGDDEVVTLADGGAHVGDVAGDGDGGVRRQRPGRRRPDQEVGAGPGTVGEREADVDRGVDVVLVPEGDLVVGQRRLVARAVRGDAVVLDQQALVEDGLERPPDALDVARGHRQVGLVEVHPVAHALGHRGERRDVAQRRLLAGGVELRDAVLSRCRPCSVKPSSFSTASSTGRPWQSQPARRGTL